MADQYIDTQIDAALDSYPVQPLPPGFIRRTMTQIRPRVQVRFRVHFLDLALPAFFVIFLLVMVLVLLQIMVAFDPLLPIRLQTAYIWLSTNGAASPLLLLGAGSAIAVVLGMVTVVVLAIISMLGQSRPAVIVPRM